MTRYLRLDPARSEGFVRAAEALFDAGASANTGWREEEHEPAPTWEPVLYGAAGIAHHPELTRLLLERGADPNDNEVGLPTGRRRSGVAYALSSRRARTASRARSRSDRGRHPAAPERAENATPMSF